MAAATSCTKSDTEPLKLDRNVLTVDNRSDQEWRNVEIWLNTYYRVTASSIPAKSRFQTPLDNFVAGFGQRFSFRGAQIKDLRLTATLPDGTTMEIKKDFAASGLGALKPRS
ncbi:MAG TPA: hypothetical protein VH583_12850 [Vicinamibacterales bacterium]|jgi:hypothetical protein